MNEIISLFIMGCIMYFFAWFQAWQIWGKKLKALHKGIKENE